jgi:tetratricopeptide (TPR) repeat protein
VSDVVQRTTASADFSGYGDSAAGARDQDVQRLSRYFSQRAVVGGHDLAKEGMTGGASVAFDAAIQADPTNAQAFYWRGRAHLKSGDMARAREDFQRAVTLDPTHFGSHQNLDYLLAREQRWDEIIAMWTEYLARKPDDGAAYLERAGAERRRGNMTQAIADVRRACELGNAQACTIARSLPAQSNTSS